MATTIWVDITASAYYGDYNGYIRFANQVLSITGAATASSANGLRVFSVEPGKTYRVTMEMRNRFRLGCIPNMITGQTVTNYVFDPLDSNDATDQGGAVRTLQITSLTGQVYLCVGAWSSGASAAIFDTLNTIVVEEQQTAYTVTFQDWDGSVLKTEQVAAGGSATPPADPTRTGYVFVGWDGDYTDVGADTTVTAAYVQVTPGAIELRALIAGTEYAKSNLMACTIERGLFDDTFSIGNVCAAVLRLTVLPQNTAIPRMAEIQIQYNTGGGWRSKGIFYTDTRSKSGNALSLVAYDAILKLEVTFLAEGSVPEFPMLMTDAVDDICTAVGVTLDARTVLNASWTIDYPNEMTMREVLGHIASAHGGNWIVTEEGKLRLVVLTAGTANHSLARSYVREEEYDVLNISRVTMFYDDEHFYTAGNDTQEELTLHNPWATQSMVNYVQTKMTAITYRGYAFEQAYLSPAVALGDIIAAGTPAINYFACSLVEKLGINYACDVSAPGEKTVDHEYPYIGQYAKNIKQRVALGAVYEGVSISRADGLVIEQSTGDFRVQMKSNLLTFQRKNPDSNVMEDALYYDTAEGKFRIADNVLIDGTLQADALVTDALYAEQGDISQLRVDELETSRKVTLYLTGDTSDCNYARVHADSNGEPHYKLITGSVKRSGNTPLTGQLSNRYGNPLYWARDITGATITNGYPYVDGERVYIQTEVTAYPVTVYQYDEFIKRTITFKLVNGVYLPVDTWGAGSDPDNPSWGTFVITKTPGGAELVFITDDGVTVPLTFTQDTIIGDGWVDAKHRRPTAYDFSALTSGNEFTETVEGGVTNTYSVTRDANEQIDSITDANGNTITITW